MLDSHCLDILVDYFYLSPPSWRTYIILRRYALHQNLISTDTTHISPSRQSTTHHTHDRQNKCDCITMSSSPSRVWTMSLIRVEPVDCETQFQMKVGDAASCFEQRRLWEECLRRFVVCIRVSRSEHVLFTDGESNLVEGM